MAFSNQNGLEFAPPYYLNLAPNYDATLIPRYFQKRGWGAEAEFRHLSDWQQSRFVGSFLADDKQYDGTYEKDDFERAGRGRPGRRAVRPADRWLYGMYHEGNVGYWQTTVNYTAVSDRDYFRNLDTDLDVASQRELERRGEIHYLRGGLDVSGSGRSVFSAWMRSCRTPTSACRSSTSATGATCPAPSSGRWVRSAVSFDRRNDDLSGVNKIVGERAHIEPRLRLPLSRSWGFMNFTGGYRYTAYDLRDTADDVITIPPGVLPSAAWIPASFSSGICALFGTAAVHTLEPRVYYLYQEYKDQDDLPLFDVSNLTFRYDQLWRDNRFSGLDRIGDANQLSVGPDFPVARCGIRAGVPPGQHWSDPLLRRSPGHPERTTGAIWI